MSAMRDVAYFHISDIFFICLFIIASRAAVFTLLLLLPFYAVIVYGAIASRRAAYAVFHDTISSSSIIIIIAAIFFIIFAVAWYCASFSSPSPQKKRSLHYARWYCRMVPCRLPATAFHTPSALSLFDIAWRIWRMFTRYAFVAAILAALLRHVFSLAPLCYFCFRHVCARWRMPEFSYICY